ncbi:MAG: hypothetical protein JSR44_07560 [Spirochaetes bacterium]|nr:hypothetical protein [Spirochaetota bacterium]
MSRSKPKKVFYNRRYKLPAWAQVYSIWGVIALIVCVAVFFTAVEKISSEPAAALGAQPNAFANSLYYELRETEESDATTIVREAAAHLKEKNNFKLYETTSEGCRILSLEHGKTPAHSVGAVMSNNSPQAAYTLMVFLERLTREHPQSNIAGKLIFASKNCHAESVLRESDAHWQLALVLESAQIDAGYERALHLKNLNLRRHFESAFFMAENTRWANILSLIGTHDGHILHLPVRAAWAETPAAMQKENPLWRHPLVSKNLNADYFNSAALYLGQRYQLMPGGFIALAILFFLLAVLPLVNALGAFRERLAIGAALTNGVVYGVAFFIYFALFRVLQNFSKTEWLALVFALALLPAIFVPVRILQRSVLSDELNRAGIHLLVFVLLIAVAFMNIFVSLGGLTALLIFSAFSRATLSRKIMRLTLIVALAFIFYFIARQPLGSFGNFMTQLLPTFSTRDILALVLFSLAGGNLVALLLVPRDRV